MRKPLSVVALFCIVSLLAGTLAWAGSRGRDLPPRYSPGSMDGRLVEALNPVDGTLWAAWAYRNGAEYDLAIAYRDDQGFWSEPTLIGIDDGMDQTQPALTADTRGNVYLAYTEESPGRIMLVWLQAGASGWSTPVSLTAPEVPGKQPALRVVGDRLVIGFRSDRGLVILDLPLLDPIVSGDMIEDGPDPVGAYDPVDPANPVDDPDEDPLVPFNDTSGGGWGSATTD
jgi:hypothetical protein